MTKLRAALLASSVFTLASTLPATAQTTWLANPVSGELGNASNWSNGVPAYNGTAYFDASNVTALTTPSFGTLEFDSWIFNASASNYTVTNQLASGELTFSGAGIVINGGSLTIISNSILSMRGSSSLGTATVDNSMFVWFYGSSTAGRAIINNNNQVGFFGNSTAGNAIITNSPSATTSFNDYATAGNAQLINDGANTVFNFSGSTGPNGDRKLTAGSIAGDGMFILGANQLTVGGNNLSTTVSGRIVDDVMGFPRGGSLVKIGTGTMTLSGFNSHAGGTTFAGGTVSVSSENNLGDGLGGLTFNGGTLQITGTTFNATTRNITWGAAGGGLDIADAGNTFTVSQALTGTGGLTKAGAGTLVLTGANTYRGVTNVTGGILRQGASSAFSAASSYIVAAGATLDVGGFAATIGSLAGNGTIATGTGALTAGSDNTSTTFAGVISGSGSFIKTGTGRLEFAATQAPTVTTIINGGTLAVNSDITSSSSITVNAGGTLGGAGTVGNVTMNGGTLAPGNSIGTLNVQGNLILSPTAHYIRSGASRHSTSAMAMRRSARCPAPGVLNSAAMC